MNKKRKYYIEWWNVGDSKDNLKFGWFHHDIVQEFLMRFLETGKFNLKYLRCENTGKIIYDRK